MNDALAVATQKAERTPVGPDAILLEGVSRWYGPVIGLNDVSLRIGPGVTGLLGPNGAGKSTLLNLVTGQIRPSLGRVEVLGESVWRRPRVLARVGYCPDLDRFQDEWTGARFVAAAAYLCGHGAAAARARAAALLDLVGLSAAADLPIGAYSKGMRQRVKLAQALVNDPDVLVLDEPLTGLDPVGRREIVDLVRALGREGRCVVVSSHVLHEVEAMTDQVVLLHHGRVLAEGRVHEIRSLLKGYPHRALVEPARPEDARRLAREIVALEGVVGVRLSDGRLEVETTDLDRLWREVESLVLDRGYDVRRIAPRDESLEAVFDYLVR